MWDQKLLLWWPVFWSQLALSCWQHGAATRTAMLAAAHKRPLCERTLRTPLLSLHVSMLTPNPHAGTPKHHEMRGCPLKLVPHD